MSYTFNRTLDRNFDEAGKLRESSAGEVFSAERYLARKRRKKGVFRLVGMWVCSA